MDGRHFLQLGLTAILTGGAAGCTLLMPATETSETGLPFDESQLIADKEMVADEETASSEVNPEEDNRNNLEQARLWARLDELEGVVLKLRQRLKILEKGLLLGLPPQPTPPAPPPAAPSPPPSPKRAALLPYPGDNQVLDKPVVADPQMDAESLGDVKRVYDTRLRQARELFQEGRFGKAYLEFAKLDREFEANVTAGATKYWLGRCWYKLRELSQARQYLGQFLEAYPLSPLVPSGHYYLAKIEDDLGLRAAAVTRLKNLIQQHPYEGSAEAARQMLANLQQTL